MFSVGETSCETVEAHTRLHVSHIVIIQQLFVVVVGKGKDTRSVGTGRSRLLREEHTERAHVQAKDHATQERDSGEDWTDGEGSSDEARIQTGNHVRNIPTRNLSFLPEQQQHQLIELQTKHAQ